jgi:hypothetical protein
MTMRFTLAKSAMTAAAAAMALTSGLATPQLAMAQDGPPPPPPPQTYQDCQQQKNDRAIAGGVLGAVAGAVIGNNIGRGPGRAGGSIIGGVAGAAVGSHVGASTTVCDGQVVYDAPPPPPPPPPPRCARAENRIIFPDGSVESYPVRACRDPYGRWRVAD